MSPKLTSNLSLLLLVNVLNPAWGWQESPNEAALNAARHINESSLRGHIRFLADDLLEGRGPGSRGDHLAQKYIAAQFERLGFVPAAPDGTFFQPVPLVGVTTRPPATIDFASAKSERPLTLENLKDYVVTSGKPEKTMSIQSAEVVFVGYGIQAPEYDWDDYKSIDLRGKVLLMMNNDPSTASDLFEGSRRLYYGRWDYKYEMAAKAGAAGAFIIHTTPSAGYPYQVVQTSWSGEQFELASQDGPRTEMNGWLTEDASSRLAHLGGFDLKTLLKQAESRDFQPIPLGVELSMTLNCDVRKIDTANVLAKLPGSDSEFSDEVVIFMAHHDHIGLAETRDAKGDNIYNGAVDNASGVGALLTLAQACASLPTPPKRTLLFAAVGAEEQGLLGSKHFASYPPIPPGQMAAVLNIDGVNIIGPTRDLNVIGLGKSSMDEIVEQVATWQNRVVVPDPFPDRGYYYRSDQFSLAKIGVPGVYTHSGIHVVGKPEGWGKARLDEWTETRYHQTSDEYSDDWNLKGAVQDIRLLFYTGLITADRSELPRWTPGDEFEAARIQALKDVR
jgi:hypothetical protein